MLPTMIQVRHQFAEGRIRAQSIEAVIVRVQRITGEAIISGGTQPAYCVLWAIHQGVSSSDRVCGVMKVTEALPIPYRRLDASFG